MTPISETENQTREEAFGWTSLWISGQKLQSGPPNPGEKAFCHGRAARTSTKRGRSERFRADSSFPTICPTAYTSIFESPGGGVHKSKNCSESLQLYSFKINLDQLVTVVGGDLVTIFGDVGTTLIFFSLLFRGKGQENPRKKQGFFSSSKHPKSLEDKGKTPQKARKSQKQAREGQGSFRD